MEHSIRIRRPEELIVDNLLVKVRAGSHAYGTSLPTSDLDFRGIFCADPVHIRTPFFTISEASDTSEEDTKLHELVKFMKLYLDCNPNILDLLWTDPEDIVYTTNAYTYLRSFRKELLSSKAAHTFSGYAVAQLKRIKGHKKWIMNPEPEEPPRQSEFVSLVQWFGRDKMIKLNIEEWRRHHRLVPYGGEIYGVHQELGYDLYTDDYTLNTTFEGQREDLGYPIMIVKFNKEEYKQHKDRWAQYWEWKKNRNPVRAKIEEEFGADLKHAMHLVRLLRMGAEILKTGEVIVKRPDAEELLSIRQGAWTYEEIIKYAEDMDREIKDVLYHSTELPKRPDVKLAAKVLMDVQDFCWSSRL